MRLRLEGSVGVERGWGGRGGGGCGVRGVLDWASRRRFLHWATHTPASRLSGTFLLPSSFARTGYATEGALAFFNYFIIIIILLLISAQLFTDSVSVFRKVWVLITLRASLSGIFLQNRCLEFDSELRFPAPSSKTFAWSLTPRFAFRHLPATLCQNWLCQWRVTPFISARLSTDAVSALRKVWVLIRLWKQCGSVHALHVNMRRVRSGNMKRVPFRFRRVPSLMSHRLLFLGT